MCNTYRFRPLTGQPFEELRQNGISLEFPHGRPNIEPRDDIRIGDPAAIVTWRDGPVLQIAPWAWRGPQD